MEHARHVEVQVLGLGDGRVLRLASACLFASTPVSEDGRRSARGGASQTTRNRLCEAAVDLLGRDPLPKRRNGRVSLRRRARRFLFHGGQRAHPGRASCLGNGHGSRPRPAAAKDRGGRAAWASSSTISALAATQWRPASSPRIPTAVCPVSRTGFASGGLATAKAYGSTQPWRGGPCVYLFYDSMIAKLIVHAHDRSAAVERLRAALKSFVVEGMGTNIPFLRAIAAHPDFVDQSRRHAMARERLLLPPIRSAKGPVIWPYRIPRRNHARR